MPLTVRQQNPGGYNNRAQLQKATRVLSATRHATQTWETYAQAWVKLLPISGRDRLENDQLRNRVSHRAWCPWREDVRPDHRLLIGGRVFHIDWVLDVEEAHAELEMHLLEEVT